MHHINTILTVSKLHNTAVVIPHCQVVADDKGFKLLDKASLQVTGTTGLYSSVDQTFTASHTMEEEVLGS